MNSGSPSADGTAKSVRITRRAFIERSALAAGGLALGLADRVEGTAETGGERPLVVSTWSFGKAANEAALEALRRGGSALDAVEQGVRVVEEDAAESSVGRGGIPNARGVVQLDACIMGGAGHRAGSVAALEGILHPISVARRVMEKTPHVMLVGEGARQFALAEGFETVELLTRERRRAWERWRAARQEEQEKGHDALALLVLDADGHIAGGCSTSGWGYKMPGRVGDSPIIGSGLYVDQEVGAAGATGLGETIMRYCGSFSVVERMQEGMTPMEACAETIRWIGRRESGTKGFDVNFVALDKQGRYGAAGTWKNFTYAVATKQHSRILQPVIMGDKELNPEEFIVD